jgi:hypothetical protein
MDCGMKYNDSGSEVAARGKIDFETVRRLAAALPDVEEATTRGSQALKVRGQLLAWIPAHKAVEAETLAVRIAIDQRTELMAADPEVYYLIDHYMNYPAVLVRLSRIHPDALRDLLGMVWRFVTAKASGRKRLREASPMAKTRTSAGVGPAPGLDRGEQLDRVRSVCKSIPGIIEKISHGAPTFFTPKRVFAMFSDNHHGDGRVAVWIPAGSGVQAALIEEAPDTYFKPPYVGVSGWVGVELSMVDDDQLGALIREAFGLMTNKTIAQAEKRSARVGRAKQRKK